MEGYFKSPDGIKGYCGPNDNGYIDQSIRIIAEKLIKTSELWSEGHYPHGNAKIMSEDHPIAKALNILADYDKEICVFNNCDHDPKLFKPYMPSIKNQNRWRGGEGFAPGIMMGPKKEEW